MRYFSLFAVLAISLNASLLAAEIPILDITVGQNGQVEDRSKFRRSIQSGDVSSGEYKEAVALLAPDALVIPYDNSDPLFGNGSFTFVMRCKFSELDPFPPPSPVAGRWDAAGDGRIIGFCFNGGSSPGMQFFVSSDGHADSICTALIEELPTDEWLVLVGRFEAGNSLVEQMYNDKGELIGEKRFSRSLPSELYVGSTPFSIGAPNKQRMGLSRLLVWPHSLSDAELEAALKKEFR